ncbi:MAG TPA: GNAT family protein, partial [Kofleriaceae bacterium]|nr:GNAT family protein [Kofleriaceae bacterium]
MYPPDFLARRHSLPLKPDPVTLRGTFALVEPLDLDRDVDALHDVSSGQPVAGQPSYDANERIWKYMSGGPFAEASGLRAWLAAQDAAPDGRPFVVRAQGRAVGVVNLIANTPAHLKIELGSIWYGPLAQRTGVSREVTELLLDHVFALGYLRAEWKCDAKNEPSRRAALSYGFRFEGIQDAHYIIKGR